MGHIVKINTACASNSHIVAETIVHWLLLSMNKHRCNLDENWHCVYTCLSALNTVYLRENFVPGPGFELQASSLMCWYSTIELPLVHTTN